MLLYITVNITALSLLINRNSMKPRNYKRCFSINLILNRINKTASGGKRNHATCLNFEMLPIECVSIFCRKSYINWMRALFKSGDPYKFGRSAAP